MVNHGGEREGTGTTKRAVYHPEAAKETMFNACVHICLDSSRPEVWKTEKTPLAGNGWKKDWVSPLWFRNAFISPDVPAKRGPRPATTVLPPTEITSSAFDMI